MLFNGTVLGQFTFYQATIPANNRRTDTVHILLPPLDLNSTYVRASIFNYTTGKMIDSTNFFYVRPIYRTLPKPSYKVICNDKVNSCTFGTTNFAHYVYLELMDSKDTTLRLSNNFFDLTPGHDVEVKILSNHTLASISENLKFSSLYDAYN